MIILLIDNNPYPHFSPNIQRQNENVIMFPYDILQNI